MRPTIMALFGFEIVAAGLLTFTACLPAAPVPEAPTTDVPVETIKDRAAYLPHRKVPALGGTALGILAADAQPVMAHDGVLIGTANAMAFSTAAGSYRTVWVSAGDNKPQMNGLIFAGKTYNGLCIATPAAVKGMGITEPYSLVEVEVNDGRGSPATDAFAATKFTVLDGTKEYPLQVAVVVAELRKSYDAYLHDEEKNITAAMEESRKAAIGDNNATGPRKKSTLMYVTWMPEAKRLDVRFLTRISDGQFAVVRPRPIGPNVDPSKTGRPTPRPMPGYYGTAFGVELGMAYEISKAGKIERRLVLPLEAFKKAGAYLPFENPEAAKETGK